MLIPKKSNNTFKWSSTGDDVLSSDENKSSEPPQMTSKDRISDEETIITSSEANNTSLSEGTSNDSIGTHSGSQEIAVTTGSADGTRAAVTENETAKLPGGSSVPDSSSVPESSSVPDSSSITDSSSVSESSSEVYASTLKESGGTNESKTEFFEKSTKSDWQLVDSENLGASKAAGAVDDSRLLAVLSSSSTDSGHDLNSTGFEDAPKSTNRTDSWGAVERSKEDEVGFTDPVKLNDSMDLKETTPDEILEKIKAVPSDDAAPPVPTDMYVDRGSDGNGVPKVTSGELVRSGVLSSSAYTSSGNWSLTDEEGDLDDQSEMTTYMSPIFSYETDDSAGNITDSISGSIIDNGAGNVSKDSNSSAIPYGWKRVCFQDVKYIRRSLEDDVIKFPENKADMYIFYYIPLPGDTEEPTLYLANNRAKKYDGGYLKHRYTQTEGKAADKYSAFSLQHHKTIASYRRANPRRNSRSLDTYTPRQLQLSSPLVKESSVYGGRNPIGYNNRIPYQFLLRSSRNMRNSRTNADPIRVRSKRGVREKNRTKDVGYYCTYLPLYNKKTLEDGNGEKKFPGTSNDGNEGEDDDDDDDHYPRKRFLADLNAG